MKKLFMLGCLAIAVASCKKENNMAPQIQDSRSSDELVADLIKRADKDLYAQMYNNNQRKPHAGGVDVIHGVYVWTSDVGSGTCLPHATNPCMILVYGLTTDPEEQVGVIEPGENYTFMPEENVQLIINAREPIMEKITSLKTALNSDGGTVVTWAN